MIRRIRRVAGRRGAAIVELAAIAPLLTALTIGTIELTRLVQVKHALTDCARSACRRAILPRSTNAGVTTDLASVLAAANVSPSAVTTTITVNGVAADLGTAREGDTIAVRLSVPA